MLLATKTLQAIEDCLQKDQGAKFRGYLAQLMPLAGDAYSMKEDDWRDHLGASLIGRECARELWYSFHWTTLKRFEGRMIRLFNRGHLEEPRFVALLMSIGCEVWQVDENGKQFRIKGHKGHFGGSLDGVVRGLPDIPDRPVLAEFKTHGEKSFTKLVTAGVQIAKPEHYIQMITYMGKYNLPWGIYMAVNKNNDEIHAELVEFSQRVFNQYQDRAAMIIDSSFPPPGISTTPGYFKCKFCDHVKTCHLNALPAMNCRTCVHSIAGENGEWFCVEPMADAAFGDKVPLTPENQRLGCPSYSLHPTFNPASK